LPSLYILIAKDHSSESSLNAENLKLAGENDDV